MIRVMRSIGDLRDPQAFRSWLVAIAMRQVRDSYRARVAQPPSAADLGTELAESDFEDMAIHRLGLSGQRRETAEASRWLDDEDRALLALWWQEAAGTLDRADLVQAMGQPAAHVAVAVSRMRERLDASRLVVRALRRDAAPARSSSPSRAAGTASRTRCGARGWLGTFGTARPACLRLTRWSPPSGFSSAWRWCRCRRCCPGWCCPRSCRLVPCRQLPVTLRALERSGPRRARRPACLGRPPRPAGAQGCALRPAEGDRRVGRPGDLRSGRHRGRLRAQAIGCRADRRRGACCRDALAGDRPPARGRLAVSNSPAQAASEANADARAGRRDDGPEGREHLELHRRCRRRSPQSGASWYYDWGATPSGIAAPSNVGFVPMIWGAADVTPATLSEVRQEGSTLLGFNEPDLGSQSNMTVAQALSLWPQLVATGMTLGSPAVADTAPLPAGWLDQFMHGAKSRGYRVNFITVHWYGGDFDTASGGQRAAGLPAGHLRPVPPADLADRVRPDRTSADPGVPDRRAAGCVSHGGDGHARRAALRAAIRLVRAPGVERQRDDRPVRAAGPSPPWSGAPTRPLGSLARSRLSGSKPSTWRARLPPPKRRARHPLPSRYHPVGEASPGAGAPKRRPPPFFCVLSPPRQCLRLVCLPARVPPRLSEPTGHSLPTLVRPNAPVAGVAASKRTRCRYRCARNAHPMPAAQFCEPCAAGNGCQIPPHQRRQRVEPIGPHDSGNGLARGNVPSPRSIGPAPRSARPASAESRRA